MKRIGIEMSISQLVRSDGTPVVLEPPHAGQENGYHIFLSHVWTYAQDQAGTIKSMLRSLVPSCVTFLDVDDLQDISKVPFSSPAAPLSCSAASRLGCLDVWLGLA